MMPQKDQTNAAQPPSPAAPMMLCENCGCYHNRAICPFCDNPAATERLLRILDGEAA